MKFNYEGNSLKAGIYKIVNTHNGRIYIGSAREFKERWQNGHFKPLLSNRHQNKFLQADFNKCRNELGHDDFLEFYVVQLMEGSTKEERKNTEQEWIDKHFDNGKQCYNLKRKTTPSREDVPSKNPEETRRKKSEKSKQMWADPTFREKMLSASRSGENSPSWGRKHTPEAIEKIKEARSLQVCSEETRAKMSQAGLGRACSESTKQKIGEKNSQNMKDLWQDPKYRHRMAEAAGHEQTAETRVKISEGLKGRKKSLETIERMREARKKLWADPAFRERMALAKKQP